MFTNLLYNTFKYKEKNTYSTGDMNHCSTICPHHGGVIIAWYAGTRECGDDQRVYITYNNITKALEHGTGNPVLWNYGDHTYLLYSKFENMVKPMVHRWKYCSLWLRTVEIKKRKIELGIKIQLTTSNQHLLGRCAPIENILPLYDEVNRQSVIMDLNKFDPYLEDVQTAGIIGTDMIQPAIWKEQNTYHTLNRNFGGPGSKYYYSRYSHSTDLINWSKPEPTEIPNNNSSLCTVKWNNKQLLLYNNTKSIQRTNLTLGTIKMVEGIPTIIDPIRITGHGGYPSMCIDKYNRLHMTYTNSRRQITHRIWNLKYFHSMKGVGLPPWARKNFGLDQKSTSTPV